jgi:DNA-binding NarL/FixJ family response regulator
MVKKSLPIPVVIAALSRNMLSSLRTFLSTIDEVNLVDSVSSVDDAYEVIKEKQPRIVVVDADLLGASINDPEIYQNYLHAVQDVSDKTACIVLVNTFTQKQISLQAGVAFALIKGELNEQLRMAIHEICIRTCPQTAS